MKKLIAGTALVATILGSGAAALAENAATITTTAQADASVQASSNLPNVSLTPDKMLYVLKMWAEKIQLVVTTDSASKAALLETQAQTRLAEARAMAQAGKQDLAQAALLDAKLKLEAAHKAIEAAAKTNKDMSQLTAKLDADQISFTGAITAMLAKAPDSVRAEFQPVAAELMVQIAANQDAATKDAAAAKQAPQLATQANLKAAPVPAAQVQINTAAQVAPATAPAAPAPATTAPAAATRESVKAAAKVQAEAAKATQKAAKAAVKADDDGEKDDDIKVQVGSNTAISFPLVNVKVHGEHGKHGQHRQQGQHGENGDH